MDEASKAVLIYAELLVIMQAVGEFRDAGRHILTDALMTRPPPEGIDPETYQTLSLYHEEMANVFERLWHRLDEDLRIRMEGN